jgi:hypothetical protein
MRERAAYITAYTTHTQPGGCEYMYCAGNPHRKRVAVHDLFLISRADGKYVPILIETNITLCKIGEVKVQTKSGRKNKTKTN